MKTNNLEKRVAMFHIGRGGRFYNSGHLTFVGFNKINECHDWQQNTFDKTRDEKGKFCKPYLIDCSGNVLMDADQYQEAVETGIGILNFDHDYDTTYTTYTDELSVAELEAMSENPYYGVDEVLEAYEYEA